MKFETVRKYFLKKDGATETYPFDDVTPVYKVSGKMFALASGDAGNERINLKCDPDEAEALREQYSAVIPGYHMNKRHWNTVILDGSIPDDEIYAMIDHSYNLVVKKQSKNIEKNDS